MSKRNTNAINCLIILQLGKLTVAVLKEIVKKEGITPDGTRKAELIDAINDHFGV